MEAVETKNTLRLQHNSPAVRLRGQEALCLPQPFAHGKGLTHRLIELNTTLPKVPKEAQVMLAGVLWVIQDFSGQGRLDVAL